MKKIAAFAVLSIFLCSHSTNAEPPTPEEFFIKADKVVNSLLPDENEFQIWADLRVKYFITSDEPDLMQRDYSDSISHPNFEVGIDLHAVFFERVKLDARPYFWTSEENQIAKIGLIGEIKWEFWKDHWEIGYGHHSWHNADKESPDGGRSQDWLMTSLNITGALGLGKDDC